ncbi:hypothetical protein PR048_010543 [Dryococelus australis]|uniref:Uncharacterized protein n=1 Tax=Dryococelus australis TaxID=614101 RepID=A0ABQ9I304_9NEOP|nr:hypothetical protein PR048_010543 [Dryococelus australis]
MSGKGGVEEFLCAACTQGLPFISPISLCVSASAEDEGTQCKPRQKQGSRWVRSQITRIPARRTGLDSRWSSSHNFACGKRAGDWSANLLGVLPFPLLLQSGAASYSPRFTLTSSQDLGVKSRPNIFTHSLPPVATGLVCLIAVRCKPYSSGSPRIKLSRGRGLESASAMGLTHLFQSTCADTRLLHHAHFLRSVFAYYEHSNIPGIVTRPLASKHYHRLATPATLAVSAYVTFWNAGLYFASVRTAVLPPSWPPGLGSQQASRWTAKVGCLLFLPSVLPWCPQGCSHLLLPQAPFRRRRSVLPVYLAGPNVRSYLQPSSRNTPGYPRSPPEKIPASCVGLFTWLELWGWQFTPQREVVGLAGVKFTCCRSCVQATVGDAVGRGGGRKACLQTATVN